MIKKEINIIGGGCAALSLARLIRNLPNYKFNLFIGKKNKTIKIIFGDFGKLKLITRLIIKQIMCGLNGQSILMTLNIS